MKRILLLTVLLALQPAPFRAENEGKAPEKGTPGSLQVVNERGQVTTLTADDLAKLPSQKIKATGHSGMPATYEGISLADVLRAAKVTLGEDLKGPLLANGLVVEGPDGYRVVFSLPEVDPALTDKVVLLAERKEGKPLDAKEGPFRLVVPHDKKAMRWVRQVTRIAVQRAAMENPGR
jgi:DMSO/TMAO reductase YedYZ molybdopterin-dependent catalytic subunit